jgi:hypothetical protein
MRTRVVVMLAGAAVAMLAFTSSALASGRGTVTQTVHGTNEVLFSMPVVNPCSGASGTLTAVAARDVFHITQFTNGDEFWVTGTAVGTATFSPDDPSGPSASGHFTSWFGESSNEKNDVQHDTNSFHLNFTDGSSVIVHADDHLSTNAAGRVTVSFSTFRFTCG